MSSALQALQTATSSVARAVWCGSGVIADGKTQYSGAEVAHGYTNEGELVPGTRLSFPGLAAGGLGTAHGLAAFWRHLLRAYAGDTDAAVTPATARAMLASPVDLGALEFMNAEAGLGVFIAQAGPNKIALHQAVNDHTRCTR